MRSDPQAGSKPDQVAVLRDPATIRARAHQLLKLGINKELAYFDVNMDKLGATADYTADVIRASYPDLKIPYHGRWRHFTVGNIDRWAKLQSKFGDKDEMVRAAIDLAVISVLLDAGAGPNWAYKEEGTNISIGRSEGLALAIFDMFSKGLFSSDRKHPCRVDAAELVKLDGRKLVAGFHAGPKNPLEGIEGRIQLVKGLAKALHDHPKLFGKSPARPGNLYDTLAKGAHYIDAKDILAALLEGFGTIWPGRMVINGQNMGDVWKHGALEFKGPTNHLMPFHKLSQWMTYSLLEPFEWAGVKVAGLDELTGLAEYRNGGLFIDTGVLSLVEPEDAGKAHKPSDEIIVEWRALTVALLDELRLPVAERLGILPEKFPLARLLEGGTWQAGRKIAKEKREGGEPPLKILSDGTVF